MTIVVSESDHKKYSETYGGRNTKKRVAADASKPHSAVRSNIESYLRGYLQNGSLTIEQIESFENLYKRNIQQGIIDPRNIVEIKETEKMFDRYKRKVN